MVVANLRDSLAELNWVRNLTDQGRFAEVIGWLRDREPDAITGSPTLALCCGIAHGRLGHHDQAARWVDTVLSYTGDRPLHTRALNVRGAIALETGRLDEASDYFVRALAEAKAQGALGTLGRCCNNLGIVANLRGQHLDAVSWYTLALAAFQRAGWAQGIAETENDLRITYRDLGQLDYALESADRAVYAAEGTGNLSLLASAIAGRAEIRALRGEPQIADREIHRALMIHRDQEDVMGEAEDLRVLALTTAALGDLDRAERTYREAIEQAEVHHRPALGAEAGRDLALLLAEQGRYDEARDVARAARVWFSQLGAEAQVRRLDAL
ncbi:MAG: tetratricopeptide repeat protein, partial [Gemmatimonadota bacterium]|nr:tetratricopeptide repeat protein [Gemmatimonadota bacterium]